jgi:hypothetical protein
MMTHVRHIAVIMFTIAVCGIALAQPPSPRSAPPSTHQPALGRVIDLADMWFFQLGDNAAFVSPALDDSRWDARRLPVAGAPMSLRFSGYAWYRRHIDLAASDLTSDLALCLGPAGEVVEVYVNGALVGHRGVFGSRPVGGARDANLISHVPAALLHAGDNVIAVRVLDPTFNGGLATGPLAIGPTDLIIARYGSQGAWVIFVRVLLALAALALGAVQVFVYRGRRINAEVLWLALAGFAAAVWFLDGTGVLSSMVPNLSLALRLPAACGLLTLFSVAGYGSARFDDVESRHVRISRLIIAFVCAATLLVPEDWVFRGGEAVTLVAALCVALYGAGLLLQAARRQERSSLWLFTSFVILAALVIYDGLKITSTLAWPPLAAVGALGVILTATWASALEVAREHDVTWARLASVQRRLDEALSINILDATAMSITDAQAFLRMVVQEAARELEVRRCSLALVDGDGELYVRASIGLPKEAANVHVPREGTFAGWVFEHGQALTAANVPPELVRLRRQGQYATNGFISCPVKTGARMLGVLNVSDRADGAPFHEADEARVNEVAVKMALVLTRLGGITGAPAQPR